MKIKVGDVVEVRGISKKWRISKILDQRWSEYLECELVQDVTLYVEEVTVRANKRGSLLIRKTRSTTNRIIITKKNSIYETWYGIYCQFKDISLFTEDSRVISEVVATLKKQLESYTKQIDEVNKEIELWENKKISAKKEPFMSLGLIKELLKEKVI